MHASRLKIDISIGIVLVIALLLALCSLPGCALLKENPSTAKLLVQYSVAKYAEQFPAESRVTHLNNIKTIASATKSLAGNDSATLTELQNVVNVKLADLHLSPADTLLAAGLVDVIAEQLKKKISEGILSAEDKLVVSDVMDWIVQAATLSGAT